MNDEGSTPRTMITSLPILPHPSSLAIPGAPSAFFVGDAQRAYEHLARIRRQVVQGPDGYILDPPSESSLPPLPPIPLPPTSQYRRSSLVTRSSAPHPIVKPPIPSSSPLSSVHTLDDCLAAFNGLFEGYIAQKRYEGGAVYVDLNCESAAWIFLNNLWQGEDPGVECVRMFTQAEATENRPVHSISSAPHRVLSRHLTDLHLSLPELLYRLPGVPSLFTQSCIFCHRHLRVPDGLPVGGTGWLDSTSEECKDDGKGESMDEGQERVEGKWVCWHTECEPSP